jgi:hypothetical protein
MYSSVESPWGPKMLHHKYMLIDADHDSSAIVITGSQNWSNNGEQRNDENILIIHSADIANQYPQEFVERYREAGGEYVGINEPEDRIQMPDVSIEFHVFPNPFRTTTTISFRGLSDHQNIGESEIQIFDVTGRIVRTFSPPTAYTLLPARIEWSGKDDTERILSPGVYFLRIGEKQVAKVR